MSDLLRRLVGRALGQGALVRPLVGSRFGREPELLSERGLDEPAAAPARLAAGETRRALPPSPERQDDEEPPAEALPAGDSARGKRTA